MKFIVGMMLVLLPNLSTGTPIILLDAKVAQFRQAAESAQAKFPAAELVDVSALGADTRVASAEVIVAVGQKPLSYAQELNVPAPMVFCMVLGDPEIKGPLTGVAMEPDPRASLFQLHALLPAASRIGWLYQKGTSARVLNALAAAAKEYKLELVAHPIESAKELPLSLATLAGQVDLLWLNSDPRLFSKELLSFLLNFSAERKLPLIGFLESYTRAGALASFSPDYPAIGAQAGLMAAKIYEGKEKALPAPAFVPGQLSVNLRTAAALGLKLNPKALEAARSITR